MYLVVVAAGQTVHLERADGQRDYRREGSEVIVTRDVARALYLQGTAIPKRRAEVHEYERADDD